MNRRKPLQVLIFQAFSALGFLVGSAWLGLVVRRNPGGVVAEKASRISHLLFWILLILPGVTGLFYPGLARYDALLGLPSLPLRPVTRPTGVLLLVVGLGLMAASNRSLLKLGSGSAAFLLTRRLVSEGIYGRTRNPMSLGFYLACVGLGTIAGSTAVTLGSLLVILPIHAFNLKYFEERELERRFGEAYLTYSRRVPFLLPRLLRNGKGHSQV